MCPFAPSLSKGEQSRLLPFMVSGLANKAHHDRLIQK